MTPSLTCSTTLTAEILHIELHPQTYDATVSVSAGYISARGYVFPATLDYDLDKLGFEPLRRPWT